MNIPNYIDPRWLTSLENDEIMKAEAALHAIFHAQETAQKRRSGARYVLLEGPADLVNAWHRWSLVSNEARHRGLVVHRRA
jgi:hypothetical protein